VISRFKTVGGKKMTDKYNEQYAQGYRDGTKRASLYAVLAGGVGIAVGAMLNRPTTEEAIPIQAEGFPKGYHIENVEIPTRGDIIRVEMLPGENYQKTVDQKTGVITFTGPFEYEIKPLRSALPKDDMHTDSMGNSPYDKDSKKYWTDVRSGKVTLQLDKKSLEEKLKK
jgi:hypothetical protein